MTDAQRYAEQLNICMRATAMVDEYCNQPLRATLNTETLHGPDFRVTQQVGSGLTRMILQRWPVLEVVSVKVAPNAVFPRSWTTVTSGYWDIEVPTINLYGSAAPSAAGEGGQAILLAPGYIDWCLGRNGYVAQIEYVNGWPHTSLTVAAAAAATSLTVDDCTGWAITAEAGQVGATGVIYDANQQEVIQVTAASATSGPGTLTLSAGLQFAHQPSVLVSALPASVQWAAIMFCAAEALTRGATSTTVHQIPGGSQPSGSASNRMDLIGDAEMLLHPYRRSI